MSQNPTPKTVEEKIEVMQHFQRGGKVERRAAYECSSPWALCELPLWDWIAHDYRIKPNAARVWVHIHRNGEVVLCQTQTEANNRVVIAGGRAAEMLEVVK